MREYSNINKETDGFCKTERQCQWSLVCSEVQSVKRIGGGGVSNMAVARLAQAAIAKIRSCLVGVDRCSRSFTPTSYRGELSFLPPVHFCICWRDSAVLSGYNGRRACVFLIGKMSAAQANSYSYELLLPTFILLHLHSRRYTARIGNCAGKLLLLYFCFLRIF